MSDTPSSGPLSDATLGSRLELARHVAKLGGQHTLNYFLNDVQVDRKADDSPVTIADREVETMIRQEIQAAFPQDAFLGEEFGGDSGDSVFRWIVDPIDGTKSFIHGVPLYATLVGIEYQGRSVVGVIELPALGETVFAQEGHGTWIQHDDSLPERTCVADLNQLQNGLFVTSERSTFDCRDAGDAFARLEKASRVTRTWGDAYGYALVATGRAAVMVDPIMEIWDAAAVAPIVREAGGVFTDWQGRPSIHSREGIGAAPGVHAEVLKITRDFRQTD